MKKLVKVLMMMALVFGAASCSDQDDAPVMPNNPADNQEEVDKDPINIAKMMKEEASGYDNITFIDNTTETEMDGGMVPLSVDFSSFKDYATIIILEDLGIKYEIY